MTQYIFRGNLSAAKFPLVSTFSGRSIIIPQFDQNFQKLAAFSGADQDRDIGIPQVFYAENIIPTAEGFQSVGYSTLAAAYDTAPVIDFDRALIIRDEEENKAVFVPARGQNYFYNAEVGEWARVSPETIGFFPDDVLVTIAYLQGRTIYYYDKTNAYEYDFTTNTRTAVTLTGLTIANIVGICASLNYLIAWDVDNQVYWSSTTDFLDFTPSLSTGAGSEKPSDLKGDITMILPFSSGFIIYTTRNAILAAYTGNIRFPWVFKEIPGSGGVEDPEHVSWEANVGYHIAWTTNGLMKISKTGAEPLFPEITDFIAARIYESYIAASKLLSQEYLTNQLYLKVTLINTRFVIISYGPTNSLFTHALFADLAIKRLGKLRIDHRDCFEWPVPNKFGVHTYDQLLGLTYDSLLGTTYTELSIQQQTLSRIKKSIAFLQSDGTVKALNFDLGNFDAEGVFFLGKFQMVRLKIIQLLNVDVENVDIDNSNFSLTVLTSYDGKNFDASYSPPLVQKKNNLMRYGGRITGENHTLLFEGAFNLVSTILTVQNAGDR